MAYTVPTAADLIARYPAFSAVPSATIDVHIGDASTQAVDTSWAETDYAAAIAAKAAHEMALLGLGEQGEAAGYAAAGVTQIRSGNFQASFSGDAVKKASGGGLDATPYGRAYKRLLRKNKGGPRLAGGGVSVDPWGPLALQNNGLLLP